MDCSTLLFFIFILRDTIFYPNFCLNFDIFALDFLRWIFSVLLNCFNPASGSLAPNRLGQEETGDRKTPLISVFGLHVFVLRSIF